MHDLPKKRVRRKPRRTPATELMSYFGTCDGIRYGRINFGGLNTRTYHFDRLNRVLRIYTTSTNTAKPLDYDTDPDHHASALAALLKREPLA